ncbi:MAG: FAD-dependent oxidoreductase [Cyanobacteria bacterium P01_D01_bin.73]
MAPSEFSSPPASFSPSDSATSATDEIGNDIEKLSTIYIIGGGIAGLLTAQALLRDMVGDRLPYSRVVIVERAGNLGLGLTRGNGRSLTATEGLVAAGMMPAEVERALVTPLERGGYAYPGFVPTAADRAQMDGYTAGLQAIATDIANRDLAMVRFGLATLTQWQQWAKDCPDLAAKSGFYLSEKLRIYGGKRARERAIAEVERLNQAGTDCGWLTPGRLVTYRDALGFDPAMEAYLGARLDDDDQFAGALTLQPGGAIHVGRLVEALTRQLLATKRVSLHTETQVQDIQWRSPGTGLDRRIAGLTVAPIGDHLKNKVPGGTLGTPQDQYIFATGFDNLLHRSGAIAAPLFPVAGTSITLVLPPKSATPSAKAFPQRAWKQDHLGPLVFSPTFDTVLNRWVLRIGGFKFYPGANGRPPLDFNHPGVQWAIAQQIQQAIAFMPDTMAQLLGQDNIAPQADWTYLKDKINPWAGLRPLYADGMAALGPFASNGYAISGTGSWGLSSGIGNGALIVQWLRGIPSDQITLPSIPTPLLQDYLRRVDPLRFREAGM